MTRYDPFSYGQVRLGGEKTPPGGAPDDILFADGAAAKQAAPADSSWDLLHGDVEGLLPGGAAEAQQAVEFGTEILGETMPEAPPAPRARPRPASKPRPQPAATSEISSPARPAGTPARREVGARTAPAAAAPTAAAAAPAAIVEPRAPAPVQVPVRRPMSRAFLGRRRLSGVLVPAGLFAAGGVGCVWLHMMQQNLVLAGIVGAATLVATAFSWVLLRG